MLEIVNWTLRNNIHRCRYRYIEQDILFEAVQFCVQERRNSSVLAMELRLSCTKPSIYYTTEDFSGNISNNCFVKVFMCWSFHQSFFIIQGWHEHVLELYHRSVKASQITSNSMAHKKENVKTSYNSPYVRINRWSVVSFPGFPSQRTSNMESTSMVWCHHVQDVGVFSTVFSCAISCYACWTDIQGWMAEMVATKSIAIHELWLVTDVTRVNYGLDYRETSAWLTEFCSSTYSISQEICTRFCCALLCCGYVIIHNEFTWCIYPYSPGLLCWHCGNR